MLSKNILNGFKNGGNPLVATVSGGGALLNALKSIVCNKAQVML